MLAGAGPVPDGTPPFRRPAPHGAPTARRRVAGLLPGPHPAPECPAPSTPRPHGRTGNQRVLPAAGGAASPGEIRGAVRWGRRGSRDLCRVGTGPATAVGCVLGNGDGNRDPRAASCGSAVGSCGGWRAPWCRLGRAGCVICGTQRKMKL